MAGCHTLPTRRWLGALLALPTVLAANDDLRAGIDAYDQVDYPHAIELLTPFAEQGNAEAALFLGMIYDPSLHGSMHLTYQAMHHDVIEALRWYFAGYAQGSAAATCLGHFLLAISDLTSIRDKLVNVRAKSFIQWTSSDQVEHDARIARSERELEQAATQEGLAAFLRMRGCGESQQPRGQYKLAQVAIETLERGARAGSGSDALYLGHVYWFETDNVSAYAWYEVAAALGNRHAEFYRFLMTQALREREYAPAEAKAAKLLEELALEFAPMEPAQPIEVQKRTNKSDNFDTTPIRLSCRRRPETGSHRHYTDCVKLWKVN